MPLEIRVGQKNNIIKLDLAGRIDIDSANLIEVIGQCLHDGYTDILCNFEEVEFIDYMGVSLIVVAYKEIANNRGRMKFLNIPTHLRGIFSICGLDKIIEIYAEEDAAVNSFSEDKAIENIKKMQLRRRFKRLPIDIKVELKAVQQNSPACYKVDILDLSGVGAYIFGCDKFKLGDDVVIRLKLSPKQEQIDLEARVVWLSDKQVQHQIHPGMGVEFRNIPTTLQQKLVEFIERNLSFTSTE
ncbi:MAG: anti-sigma factor antagonist [Candidatus Omnitrophica bacterium]|nr:anti-sigma factor antagonist [Candidatus Omnitrophota bacterium]